MCQMNVVMEKDGRTEVIMKEVIHLEVGSEGTLLSSFFEKNKLIPGTQVGKIDFMKTMVTLVQVES